MANYCVYSGRTGTSTGTVAGSVPSSTEWDNAYISLSECLTSITEADGDTIFVAHDHARSYGAATTVTVTLSSGCVRILSIDRTNTTTATLKAGALEQTGGATSYALQGPVYVYGCTFQSDGGISSGNVSVNNVAASFGIATFENCTLKVNNSNSSSIISVGATDTGANKITRFVNCTFSMGGTSQGINLAGGLIEMENCSLAGTAPTTLIRWAARNGVRAYLNGCSFSTPTNLVNAASVDEPHYLLAANCKVPSSITTGTHPGPGAGVYELHACTTSDSILDYYYQDGAGVIQESTSIYLTTGGSQMKQADGTLTSYSLEMNPSTVVSKAFPLYSPWVSKFVGSTGSKTFSLKIAYDDATALKDCECWLEVEYYKNTGDPLSSVEVSAPLAEGISRDILAAGTNLTDTSEAWTGTGGWSNKKTATLSKTVTVNQQGYVRCRVAVAKDVTLYADQLIGVA